MSAQVAPHVLPNLYLIFTDESDIYTIRTRTRAIEIFTTVASMICTMAESNRFDRNTSSSSSSYSSSSSSSSSS